MQNCGSTLLNDVPINLSILDFKIRLGALLHGQPYPINLSILDFKRIKNMQQQIELFTINLSILDFKSNSIESSDLIKIL